MDNEYLLVSLKNDKPRTITPAPTIMRMIQEHKRVQNGYKLRAGAAWGDKLNLVFTNEIGYCLDRFTVYSNFKRATGARFHDMRHTYAVAALRSGDDIKTVQETLGHHTAAFTLDVYAHVTEQMRKDSAARMDTFIQGLEKL